MQIKRYELALSEAELDKIINEQTIAIELIDKNFAGYQALAEGDKKALQYLVNAGKMMNDVSLEQDHHLNRELKQGLQEAADQGSSYAAKALKLFNSFNGVEGLNGIDPQPVEIFKGVKGLVASFDAERVG